MRRLNGTSRRRRQSPDRLTLVHDRELVDLIGDLNETYDALMGAALAGDSGSYMLAAVVRTAVDYLTNMRLSAAS